MGGGGYFVLVLCHCINYTLFGDVVIQYIWDNSESMSLPTNHQPFPLKGSLKLSKPVFMFAEGDDESCVYIKRLFDRIIPALFIYFIPTLF